MYIRLLTLWVLLSAAWATQAQNQPFPMTDEDFEQALIQLDNEFVEQDRLATARVLLDKNYFTTLQVRALLDRFDQKNNQEAIAKIAYGKTYDQSNFYQVYESLDYEDSRSRLRNWVRKHPTEESGGSRLPEPMAPADFERAFATIEETPFDNDKLVLIEQLTDDNYLTADQVQRLVASLDFKKYQDQIAKSAYVKTYDQQNYYRVLEAFTFTSSKRSLSNWLKGQPVIDRSTPGAPTLGTWEDPYDDGDNINVAIRYNAPDRGAADRFDTQAPNRDDTPVAPLVVSDNDFINIQNQLSRIPGDQDRLIRAKEISDQANWTTEQVRELMDLLVFENMRLDFAMYAYQRTTDAENYYLVHDALNSAEDQQLLLNYIQQLGGSLDNASSTTNRRPNSAFNHHNNTVNNTADVVTTDEPTNTGVSAQEFADLIAELQTFSSDDDRLTEAQRLLDNYPLNSNQVAELTKQVIFDDVKLELAMYGYARVQDPENYDVVVEHLGNQRDRNALRAHMGRP